MESVREIIDVFGGMARLRQEAMRVEAAGFMPLHIERIGVGPRGGVLVSVAHYYVQNGDLMADPDLTVEVVDGEWSPVAYRQDGLGVYQEAVYLDGDRVTVRPGLVNDLKQFMQAWDRNLRDQGFVDAARKIARG